MHLRQEKNDGGGIKYIYKLRLYTTVPNQSIKAIVLIITL